MAIEYGTGWRLVSDSELAEFLRNYPRPLIVEPPLPRKARFRRFLDPSLGSWPNSEVATVHHAHGSIVNAVRTDVMQGKPGDLRAHKKFCDPHDKQNVD